MTVLDALLLTAAAVLGAWINQKAAWACVGLVGVLHLLPFLATLR